MTSATDLDNLREAITVFVKAECSDQANPVELGNAFCRWLLQRLFELPEDAADEAMLPSGPNDNNIDAAFETEDEFHVVQAKYNKAHKYEAVTAFKVDGERLLNGGEIIGNRPEVREAVANLRRAVQAGKRAVFTYATSAEFGQAEGKKIKPLCSTNFRAFDLPALMALLTERLSSLPQSYRTKEFRLQYRGAPLEIDNSMVIATPLESVATFASETGHWLFQSNIRNYLKRTSVNRKIEQTLRDQPERFWYFNNGITIVCRGYRVEGSSVFLTEPQVVNGCQTVKSIQAFCKIRDVGNGCVLARLIENVSDAEREDITRFTNSQNAVRGKDFLALDSHQKTLQGRMSLLGYYYEIQRGAFDVLSRGEQARYAGLECHEYLTGATSRAVVPATEALQGYASGFLGLPHVAYARPGELLPMGDRYQDVFNEDTPSEPEYFLFPYLVARYSSKVLGFGKSDRGFRRYGRWLYVHIFFETMLRTLQEARLVSQFAENPRSIGAPILTAIFASSQVNSALLRFCDDVMDRYFEDSNIQTMCKDSVRNFMASGCGQAKAREILGQRIRARCLHSSGQELIDALRDLVGTADAADVAVSGT